MILNGEETVGYVFHDLSISQLESLYNFAYTDPSKKIIYIPIRKNASTAIKQKLISSKWRLIKDSGITDLELFYNESLIFSVLRNPYQRFLSGLNTYYKIKASEFPPIRTLIENQQFEELLYLSVYYHKSFSFDDHTCLQKTYFQDPLLKDKSITFFDLNPKIGYQLNQWLFSNNVENSLNNQVVNETDKKDKLFHTITNFFMDAKNTKYRSYLDEYLKEDYNFISQAEFYAR